MHTDLLNLLNQITKLEIKEEEMIISGFDSLKLSKGSYFLKAGEINRYIGFINSGLVRYFVIKDGEEATFEFTKKGEFIADYQSFDSKLPSIQNIQAIEDCELLIINYSNVQKIFESTKNGNLLGRVIVEQRFDVMVNQLLSIYMHSSEERYRKFVEDYSDLMQRLPLYLIASYVGVKPQSLSRIRRRFVKSIS